MSALPKLTVDTLRGSAGLPDLASGPGPSGPPAGPVLSSFVCRCRDDLFCVVAPSYGSAWLSVMDRYGVGHPAQIPRPVHMAPAVVQSYPVDAAEAVGAHERTTLRLTSDEIEALRDLSSRVDYVASPHVHVVKKADRR